MKILSEPQIISGFLCVSPVDDLPALTHCGEALCSAGHWLKPHTHPGFEFLYLSRGCASWRAGGETTRQGMGDLYVAYPGEKHGTGPERNPENYHLWVGLRLEEFGGDAAKLAARLRRARVRLLTDCQEVEPLLRGLMRQMVARRPRRTEAALAYARALVTLLLQRLDTAETGAGKTEGSAPYSHAVQKAVDYLQQNLHDRIPLADLAAVAAARSVPHFCTQFRREVGVTPAACHLRLRLHAAREALRQPACGITEAAMQHGFSSSQHFSTQFRRAFGVTPRAWQRRSG